MANDSPTSGARVVTDSASSNVVPSAAHRLLTLITAAGLAVDAYVHWHLAPSFDTLTGAASPHISQGQLFRLEAVLALAAMVLVLVSRSRLAAGFALLVAAGGVGAVLLYGYVDVGGLGPLPDMYDPAWSTGKTVSAVAEAIAAVGALLLVLLPRGASEPDN
ncbi:MAG TPA: hypothetical protein VF391_05015 [Dermatophilaceae bacterium]|jgi:hypothetical protein